MGVAESSRKVLVVEPDNLTRREIRVACEQDGYLVVEADAGSEALRQVESSRPNVVLLEVTLPDAAGFDVCRELRKMDPGVPVIMMSTRSDEIDAVVALEIGADDYVTKPLRLRDLTIDVNERRTYKAGKEVELTHTEFDLLTFLASNAGKVLSREKILNSIWGYEYPIETRVIDVHIRNLRRKIETQPSRPYYILAVPGIGYRFTNARPS